jgi:site-specific recombinase XerD
MAIAGKSSLAAEPGKRSSTPTRNKMISNPRKHRNREHLSPDEVQKLLAASKQKGLSRNPERDHALLFVMVRHGLRVSEARNLKMSDVNLEQKTIFIRRLKNGKSTTHPIYNGGEFKALQQWLMLRATIESECDNVFLSEQRTPLSRTAIWTLVQKYAQAAGLSALNVHPHSLRHSTGFDLANRGADTRLIQDFLGHVNIQHTVKYTELAPNRFSKLY